jgi:hypothetical protein
MVAFNPEIADWKDVLLPHFVSWWATIPFWLLSAGFFFTLGYTLYVLRLRSKSEWYQEAVRRTADAEQNEIAAQNELADLKEQMQIQTEEHVRELRAASYADIRNPDDARTRLEYLLAACTDSHGYRIPEESLTSEGIKAVKAVWSEMKAVREAEVGRDVRKELAAAQKSVAYLTGRNEQLGAKIRASGAGDDSLMIAGWKKDSEDLAEEVKGLKEEIRGLKAVLFEKEEKIADQHGQIIAKRGRR